MSKFYSKWTSGHALQIFIRSTCDDKRLPTTPNKKPCTYFPVVQRFRHSKMRLKQIASTVKIEQSFELNSSRNRDFVDVYER